MEKYEFKQILSNFSFFQVRLVLLYVEALRLEEEGRRHPCDRLRAVEQVLLVSLKSARRQARLGLVDEEEIAALDKGFGVAKEWILKGDLETMRDRIVQFFKKNDV